MKTIIFQKLTAYENPGGEGSTALPTALLSIYVIPSVPEAIPLKTGE
jgi:hypothetical protein